MDQIKPWQVVLFVAALIALGIGAYMTFGRSKLDLDDSIIMVDVETGELFRFSISGRTGVGVPNFNPDSGKLSLVPVVRSEGGGWVIDERARPVIADLDVPKTAIVDATTGEVKTIGSPKAVTPRSQSS